MTCRTEEPESGSSAAVRLCDAAIADSTCVLKATIISDNVDVHGMEGECDAFRSSVFERVRSERASQRVDRESAEAAVEAFFASYRDGDSESMSMLFADAASLEAALASMLADLLDSSVEILDCDLRQLDEVGKRLRCLAELPDGRREPFRAELTAGWESASSFNVTLSSGRALRGTGRTGVDRRQRAPLHT